MPASVVVRKTLPHGTSPPAASAVAAQPSPAAPAASTSRHGPPCSCPGQSCMLILEPPIFLSLTVALLLSFLPLLRSKAWLGDPSGQPCHRGLCRPLPARSFPEHESVPFHLL